MPEPSRAGGLDGLRGAAALIVVVDHCMETVPAFADASDGRPPAGGTAVEALFIYSPLHLLWAGSEAVLLFFVLSGFVLAAAAARPRFRWVGYFAGRLPRLYLPVWCSLALAAGVAAVVPRVAGASASWWVNAHVPPHLLGTLSDGALLTGTDYLNDPLWSLVWEVWFSLLLPGYLLLVTSATARRGGWVVLLLLIGALIALGSALDSNALRYLPIFALGVLMFRYRKALAAWADRRSSASGVLVLAGSSVLLIGYWGARGVPELPTSVTAAARAAQVLGALGLVYSALYCRPFVTLLGTSPLQWLGRLSFSLYLTHDSVVIATTELFGGTVDVRLLLVLAIPLSLVVAQLFLWSVEAPAHRLSRALARATSRAGSSTDRPGPVRLRGERHE